MKTLYESILDINDVESSIDPIILIDDWCKANIRGSYRIDKKTHDINSNKNIIITNKNITEFPSYIHFGTVNGNFSCSYCSSLKSLKGAPKKVGGDFSCSYCDSLTSLEGAPEKVDADFLCSECPSLTSLEGAPKEVGRNFYCTGCTSLKSLEGAPEKVGVSFHCTGCTSLTSLEGAPKEFGGYISCINCPSLKSFKDIPKSIEDKIIHDQFYYIYMKALYESLSQYLKNSIRGNQSTRILLFDVDDTLIHTSAQIIVRSSDGTEKRITNKEFNDYKPAHDETFDFREFGDPKLIDSDIPTKYLQTLKNEYAKGTHIGIITARADCKLIRKFLLKKGIDIKKELVFAVNDPELGLEGSIQEKKAQIIDHLIKAGYQTFVFFDDNEGNLSAARRLSGGKVKVITVKV